MSLLLISVDRNYAIIKALRYVDVFTPRLSKILIGTSWLASFVFPVPPLLGWGKYDYNMGQYTCALDWTFSSEFLYSFFVLCLMLPIFVQGFCYISIFKAAISHTKRASKIYPMMPSTLNELPTNTIEGDPPSNSSEESIESFSVQVRYRSMECKAVRTIVLIAFAYLVCWLPYFSVSFIKMIDSTSNPYNEAASICCVFFSGFVNPVIYAFMNRITRHEINKFFCGYSHRDTRRTSTGNSSDDYYSTTMTGVSGPSGRGSISSGQRHRASIKSESISRMLEMKTIEEEVEIANVLRSVSFEAVIADKPHFADRTERRNSRELFLSPMDYYAERRKSIHTKKEHLTSIMEEVECTSHKSEEFQSPKHCEITENNRTQNEDNSHIYNNGWCASPSNSSPLHHKSHISSHRSRRRESERDLGSFLYFEQSVESTKSRARRHSHKNSYGLGRRHGGGRFSIDETSLRRESVESEVCQKRITSGRHFSIHEGMKDPFIFVVSRASGETLDKMFNLQTNRDLEVHKTRRHSEDRSSHSLDDNFHHDSPKAHYMHSNGDRNCMSA